MSQSGSFGGAPPHRADPIQTHQRHIYAHTRALLPSDRCLRGHGCTGQARARGSTGSDGRATEVAAGNTPRCVEKKYNFNVVCVYVAFPKLQCLGIDAGGVYKSLVIFELRIADGLSGLRKPCPIPSSRAVPSSPGLVQSRRCSLASDALHFTSKHHTMSPSVVPAGWRGGGEGCT